MNLSLASKLRSLIKMRVLTNCTNLILWVHASCWVLFEFDQSRVPFYSSVPRFDSRLEKKGGKVKCKTVFYWVFFFLHLFYNCI